MLMPSDPAHIAQIYDSSTYCPAFQWLDHVHWMTIKPRGSAPVI